MIRGILMLNLYICALRDNRHGRVVLDPTAFVKYGGMDLHVYETDFAKRMLRDCSAIEMVNSCCSFRTMDGIEVGADKLSGSAHALMIMKETSYVIDMTLCGDNCNKYVAEIAREKDLYVCTIRYYNQFKNSDLDEVLVLNNNKIYKSRKEFALDGEIQELFATICKR